MHKLREIQKRLDLPEHKLIQQVETRWNSTYYMMERYMEQNEAIRTALCIQDRNDLVLSTEKNPFIEEMIRILHPFETVTTELSSEKYISASKIIPLARGLQKITNSHSTIICSTLRFNLIAQMSTRFANLEEKMVIAIATLLDPRFKKITFTNPTVVQQMVNKIISDAAALITDEPDDDSSTGTTTVSQDSINPIWEMFDQQVAESTSNRSTSISSFTELDQYFKTPVIPRKVDPLQWWKRNSVIFPMISKVAMVYLSTVATSVPSERLFSKAGELVSTKRNRIKEKNVNMMLFLNKCC